MAQDEATKGFYDFMYPLFLLKDLFDINMHQDDYVERAYGVWRDIGNIATATHAFEFTVEHDGEVILPCNVEFIESVSSGHDYRSWCGDDVVLYHKDWSMNPNYFLPDALVSMSSHFLGNQTSNLHPRGEFIPYELKGTPGNYKMNFSTSNVHQHGTCIYRGICVDSDGNPLLTRKETEAIAYKMAFLYLQKRIFMADPIAGQIMQQTNLIAEYGRKMAAAKIPEYVSQNEWNRMLTAMTSHDRKVYWSSFKSLQ